MQFNISSSDIESGKVMAAVSYLGVVGFLIALITSSSNRFVKYHAQQSLVPIILYSITFLPKTGFFIDSIIGFVAFILLIVGLINGFTGKTKPLPLLGETAYNFGLCKPDDRV